MASRVNEDKTTVKDDEAILSIFPSDPLYQWLYYKGKVPQGEREENLLRSIFMDGMDYAHDWNMVGEKMPAGDHLPRHRKEKGDVFPAHRCRSTAEIVHL